MFAFDAMFDLSCNGVLDSIERACQFGYMEWEADDDQKVFPEENYYYDDFDDYY